jgi:hypothetical protein
MSATLSRGSLQPGQQKLAEKFTILNDRGIGMLTRIYNIKKVRYQCNSSVHNKLYCIQKIERSNPPNSYVVYGRNLYFETQFMTATAAECQSRPS